MPFYTHKCLTCNDEHQAYLKISSRDDLVGTRCLSAYCEGTLIRPPEVPGFTSSESLGRVKAPGDFRNLLTHIKSQNPGSTIKER